MRELRLLVLMPEFGIGSGQGISRSGAFPDIRRGNDTLRSAMYLLGLQLSINLAACLPNRHI